MNHQKWIEIPNDQGNIFYDTLSKSFNFEFDFWCFKPKDFKEYVFSYGVYLFFAFYGCSLLKPDLTPSRLLVDDSPLTYYLQLAESRIWSEGVVGRVYVNAAPDFSTHPEEVGVTRYSHIF